MSPTPDDSVWTGCHGVRVRGESFGFGQCTGVPLATVTVRRGDVSEAAGTPVWSQRGETLVSGEGVAVERVMRRRSDGAVVVSGSHDPFVEIDGGRGVVTVGDGPESAQRQMLAAFALPLLLHDTDSLLMHSAACADGSGATLICGVSGVGKSTTLVRLVDHGWSAISEDVCAIDLRDRVPTVWPGPPWVRLLAGEDGPRASQRLFESGEKHAWDLAGVQPDQAVPVKRIVILDPPNGDRPRCDTIPTGDAIAALGQNAVWLDAPEVGATKLFGRVAQVATRVPTLRVRVPRGDDWMHALPDLIADAPIS